MTRFHSTLTRLRDRKSDEKGFTLIELLIVVLVIGVLAAIAIPVYFNVVSSAQENSAKSSVTDAKTAVVAYYTQNGSYPTTLAVAGYNANDDIPVDYTQTATTFCVSTHYKDSANYYKTTESTKVATVLAAAKCA